MTTEERLAEIRTRVPLTGMITPLKYYQEDIPWLLKLVDELQLSEKLGKRAHDTVSGLVDEITSLQERVRELEEDMECASCSDVNQVKRGLE